MHIPNRRARLAEYAERRLELMTLFEGPGGAAEVGRKRRRRLPNAVALEPIIEAPEESIQACSLMWGRAGADIGFVFNFCKLWSTH